MTKNFRSSGKLWLETAIHVFSRRIKQKISQDKKSGNPDSNKYIYMNIEFKGDRTSDVTKSRLTSAVKRTLYAAKLRLPFTSRNLLLISVNNKLPHLVASMCISNCLKEQEFQPSMRWSRDCAFKRSTSYIYRYHGHYYYISYLKIFPSLIVCHILMILFKTVSDITSFHLTPLSPLIIVTKMS